MKALLTQSFEIFNVYGKEPEALKSILSAFDMILDPYEIKDIHCAFREWMQNRSTMPTPADILAIVKDTIISRRDRSAEYFIAPERHNSAPQPHVPWHGLSWNEFTEDHKRQLVHHLNELGDKAWEYIKYLGSMVGAPSPVDTCWAKWKKQA